MLCVVKFASPITLSNEMEFLLKLHLGRGDETCGDWVESWDLSSLSPSTECLSLWLKYLIYNWAFRLRSNYSDLRQSRFYLLLPFGRFTFNRTKIIIKSKLSCWMKKFSRLKCGHCLNAVVACCNSYDFWNTSEWWWSADISLVPEFNDLIFYNLMQFFHLHIHIHSLAHGASIVVYPT